MKNTQRQPAATPIVKNVLMDELHEMTQGVIVKDMIPQMFLVENPGAEACRKAISERATHAVWFVAKATHVPKKVQEHAAESCIITVPNPARSRANQPATIDKKVTVADVFMARVIYKLAGILENVGKGLKEQAGGILKGVLDLYGGVWPDALVHPEFSGPYTVRYNANSIQEKFDLERFKADHPDLYEQYKSVETRKGNLDVR